MKRGHRFMLVDDAGDPLSPHVADALVSLVPRFHREFPLIRDHSLLTDFLEEAGRRIVKRERRSGPIEHLHGYAWSRFGVWPGPGYDADRADSR
jgi:hypothetical protein